MGSWWASGTSRVELKPGRLGPPCPSDDDRLTVRPGCVTTQRHKELPTGAARPFPGARRIDAE